jgi:hypothetical protein
MRGDEHVSGGDNAGGVSTQVDILAGVVIRDNRLILAQGGHYLF